MEILNGLIPLYFEIGPTEMLFCSLFQLPKLQAFGDGKFLQSAF